MEDIEIKLGDRSIKVELSDGFVSRAKGLSFRSSGKMLFSFPGPTDAKIDMVFLSRPLYLYFMNSQKEIIYVKKAEPWGWNPVTWKLYSPGEKYSYLLESFEDLGIEQGERLEFEI